MTAEERCRQLEAALKAAEAKLAALRDLCEPVRLISAAEILAVIGDEGEG